MYGVSTRMCICPRFSVQAVQKRVVSVRVQVVSQNLSLGFHIEIPDCGWRFPSCQRLPIELAEPTFRTTPGGDFVAPPLRLDSLQSLRISTAKERPRRRESRQETCSLGAYSLGAYGLGAYSLGPTVWVHTASPYRFGSWQSTHLS